MSFEKTKASAETNSAEDIKKDLNSEEDTSSAAGPTEENESGNEGDTSINEAKAENQEEEKVTLTKAEYDQMVSDRENYKQGMLSAKAAKRTLVEHKVTEEEAEHVDVNEEIVVGVLSKQVEKTALKNTISPKHQDFIPELIDDNQYNEIIGYLPRNVDKTSYESIVKGLKLATKLWKEERGIVDKPVKKQVELHTTKSTTSGSGNIEVKKPQGRKILKSGRGVSSWY